MKNPTILERFLKKFRVVDSGCWEYTGGRNHRGYGKFWARGKTYSAHRISYELFYEYPPDDMCVCHTCDNPCCVRPDHLFIGTNKENTHDAIQKGRFNKRGEKNSFSKLTETQVKAALKMRKEGMTFVKIGRHFNVTPQCIFLLCKKKNWSHI